MNEFDWDIWVLEEEAKKRVGDLYIYKRLFIHKDQYINELRKIVSLLPIKNSSKQGET